jgi:CO/xanthine dehydrogenase Mo-binding subunit
MDEFTTVGERIPKWYAKELVTGEAKYATDAQMTGMLYAKVLRSRHPHARILNLDTSKAEKLHGVKAIVTAKDVPINLMGLCAFDRPILASDKVRYIGDAIAGVAATDEDTAEEALSLIQVDYEILPAVFDPIDSMRPDAPIIHEEKNKYRHALFLEPFRDRGRNNISAVPRIIHGDVERGFADADYVFEDTYRTGHEEHCTIEPHGGIAYVDASGKVTIWASIANPSRFGPQFAASIGLKMSKLRILQTHTGGHFGCKGMPTIEPILALLTMKSRKPVKGVHTREEEFLASSLRHPFISTVKLGVKKEGTWTALRVKNVVDMGPYNIFGGEVAAWGCITGNGPYAIPNAFLESYAVYTNNLLCGAYRGFGNPQVAFARESLIDHAAREMGIDPVEFRLKNAWSEGSVTPTGQELKKGEYGVGIRQTLTKAAETSKWTVKADKNKRRGKGVASMVHGSGAACWVTADSSSCFIKVNDDGTVHLITGTVDVGQGSDTVLAQIVAEEMGVSLDHITIMSKDSDAIPHDLGTVASRVTYFGGNAARIACQRIKKYLFQVAGDLLEANPADLVAKNGNISVQGVPERFISIADVARHSLVMRGQHPIGDGTFGITGALLDQNGQGKPLSAYLFATTVAYVEVDTTTGQVDVLNVCSAHAVGRAINPMYVEGQIEGAVVNGVGYALLEDVVLKDGRPQARNLADYKIPTSRDLPEVKPVIVEDHEPTGPFGAKGVGEPGMVAVAPAIANAIFDAVGIRMKELPITPDKILQALREKELCEKSRNQ